MKQLAEYVLEAIDLAQVPYKNWPKEILKKENQKAIFQDTDIEEKDWNKVCTEIIGFLKDTWDRCMVMAEEEGHESKADKMAAAEEYFWSEVKEETNHNNDNDFSFNFKDYLTNDRDLKNIKADWGRVWYNFRRQFGF